MRIVIRSSSVHGNRIKGIKKHVFFKLIVLPRRTIAWVTQQTEELIVLPIFLLSQSWRNTPDSEKFYSGYPGFLLD